MIKKTITYVDYNNMSRTEDFYFNLTKAEVIDMETSMDGGMKSYLEKIVSEQKVTKIIEMFKKVIELSYGQKSPDGKRFIKSPELFKEFSQTEAYSELYISLIDNVDEAIKFVNGIIPIVDNSLANKMNDTTPKVIHSSANNTEVPTNN